MQKNNWKKSGLLPNRGGGALLLSPLYMVFISDPGIPGPIYGSECLKQTPRPFADLTDVTLADEDNNSIPTDDGKWRHLVAKVRTNASGTIWWLNL